MLIGLCGSILAGKQSVASYLVEQQGFSQLYLAPARSNETPSSSSPSRPSISVPAEIEGAAKKAFRNVEELVDHITKRWQQRWVTTDIWDEEILEKLLRRPFFLLVSVDAPLSLRWQRCKARY